VLSGDPAKVLQAAEGVFEEMPASVPLGIVADGSIAVYRAGITGTVPTWRSERRSGSASYPLSASRYRVLRMPARSSGAAVTLATLPGVSISAKGGGR
jgi:hypothetical protein